MLADLAAVLLIVGISTYTVLGGADFGTGIWDLTAGRNERMRARIKASMSPVWEANHVWLIFILVVLWTCFPRAFGSITSTLAIPLFLAAVGIILRGAAFALRGEASSMFEQRALGAVFAASSVLVPFFLGTVVGGIASGRVPVGNAAGDELTSWANETSIMIGLLAVATGAHVAAVFLGADAKRAGETDLVEAFRRRALGSGVVAGVFAVVGLAVVSSDGPDLFDDLVAAPAVVLVLLSAAAGMGTLALEWRSRFEPARWTVALAVGSIVAAWGLAQEPYLLPPGFTVAEAAAPDSTLTAVLGAVAAGLLILVPSLTWLFRLTLRGDLDKSTNT